MNQLLKMMLLRQQMLMDKETGGEGGGSGGGGTGGEGGADDGEGSGAGAAGAGEGAGADDGKKGDSREFSSEEAAKLLKENMKRKEEQRKLAEENASLKQALAQFEGVDVAELKKLAAERAAAEEERLKKSGEWDRLKAQIVEAHAREKQELAEKMKERDEALAISKALIEDLTIGNAFGNSKYIPDDLLIPPSKARALYSGHFEFAEGQLVGYDKPAGAKDRTMLIDGAGNPLSFEVALEKIIKADPDYPSIAKSKMKPGANSGTKGSDKAPDMKADVRGVSRIADALAKQKA